jgi:hypothetical protein
MTNGREIGQAKKTNFRPEGLEACIDKSQQQAIDKSRRIDNIIV